jgi:hypothetical protein
LSDKNRWAKAVFIKQGHPLAFLSAINQVGGKKLARAVPTK